MTSFDAKAWLANRRRLEAAARDQEQGDAAQIPCPPSNPPSTHFDDAESHATAFSIAKDADGRDEGSPEEDHTEGWWTTGDEGMDASAAQGGKSATEESAQAHGQYAQARI